MRLINAFLLKFAFSRNSCALEFAPYDYMITSRSLLVTSTMTETRDFLETCSRICSYWEHYDHLFLTGREKGEGRLWDTTT